MYIVTSAILRNKGQRSYRRLGLLSGRLRDGKDIRVRTTVIDGPGERC